MTQLAFLAATAVLVAALALWSRRAETIVYPPNVALLYRDGRFERLLPPGRHLRFDPFRRTKIVKVSLAELPTQLGEMTVLSKDQFSFRLGLAPVLKIRDPQLFLESQDAVEQHGFPYMVSATGHPGLHWLVAAAAMEVVALRTLPEALADQSALAGEVQQRLEEAIPGASVERVLVTSITLPPETRRMFTDVERARIEGQAALERARGEQAALRVLANAARLVNDNPGLANLRLLQAIESSKGSTTIVLGNPQTAMAGTAASSGSPDAS